MQGIMNFLILIRDNYVSILLIIALVLGITKKVRGFLQQSKEEQKKQLFEESDAILSLIRQGMLDMVVTAEKEYGSKTGKIKLSAVYNMIIDTYPDIVDYITKGILSSDYIYCCIDEGVEEMNKMIESNATLRELIGKEKVVIENDVTEEKTEN